MQGFDSSNPDLITVRYVHGSGSDIAVDRRRVLLPEEPSVRSRSRATITGGGAGGGQQGSGSGSRDDNLLVQQRTAEARSERIKTLAAEAAVIKLDDLNQRLKGDMAKANSKHLKEVERLNAAVKHQASLIAKSYQQGAEGLLEEQNARADAELKNKELHLKMSNLLQLSTGLKKELKAAKKQVETDRNARIYADQMVTNAYAKGQYGLTTERNEKEAALRALQEKKVELSETSKQLKQSLASQKQAEIAAEEADKQRRHAESLRANAYANGAEDLMRTRQKVDELSGKLKESTRELGAARRRAERAAQSTNDLQAKFDAATGVVRHNQGTREATLVHERQLRFKAEQAKAKAETDAQDSVMTALARLKRLLRLSNLAQDDEEDDEEEDDINMEDGSIMTDSDDGEGEETLHRHTSMIDRGCIVLPASGPGAGAVQMVESVLDHGRRELGAEAVVALVEHRFPATFWRFVGLALSAAMRGFLAVMLSHMATGAVSAVTPWIQIWDEYVPAPVADAVIGLTSSERDLTAMPDTDKQSKLLTQTITLIFIMGFIINPRFNLFQQPASIAHQSGGGATQRFLRALNMVGLTTSGSQRYSKRQDHLGASEEIMEELIQLYVLLDFALLLVFDNLDWCLRVGRQIHITNFVVARLGSVDTGIDWDKPTNAAKKRREIYATVMNLTSIQSTAWTGFIQHEILEKAIFVGADLNAEADVHKYVSEQVASDAVSALLHVAHTKRRGRPKSQVSSHAELDQSHFSKRHKIQMERVANELKALAMHEQKVEALISYVPFQDASALPTDSVAVRVTKGQPLDLHAKYPRRTPPVAVVTNSFGASGYVPLAVVQAGAASPPLKQRLTTPLAEHQEKWSAHRVRVGRRSLPQKLREAKLVTLDFSSSGEDEDEDFEATAGDSGGQGRMVLQDDNENASAHHDKRAELEAGVEAVLQRHSGAGPAHPHDSVILKADRGAASNAEDVERAVGEKMAFVRRALEKKGLCDKAVIIKSSDLVEFHMEHNHRDRLRNSIMARIQKLQIHETQLTVAQHQKRKEVRQLLAAARDDLDKIDQQGPHILGNFHKIMALGRSVTGTSPSTAGCLDRIGLGGVVEQMIGVKNGFVDLMLESVFIISIAWVAELSKLIREATSEIEMDGRTLWAIMSQIDLVSPTAKVHTRSHVHSSGTLLGLAKAGAGGGSDAVLGQACSKMSARNFASSGQPNYLKDVTRDQLQYETMPEKYRQVLDQSPTVERYGTGSYWDYDKYMENFGIAPAKAQIKTPHLSTVHDEVALLAVYSGMTNAWYKNLGGVEWGGDVPAYHA